MTESARTICSRLLAIFAWCVIASLATVAALRVFVHDGAHLLVWLNAFTSYVYLPAYACLVIGLWQRRRWLSAVSAAVIACHAYWLAPDFLRDRRFDAPFAVNDAAIADRRALRIFFANVRFRNMEYEAMISEIELADPDLVIFVEFSPQWSAAIRASVLAAKYPYGSDEPAIISGVYFYSKLPLRSVTRKWFSDRCVETVEIPLGSQSMHVVGLHAPRPMNYRNNDYDGFWKGVVPLLLSEPHPVVVVGDFNATQHSRVYQELKASGLRSAHEDRGRGFATTWPNGTLALPPIRIDQALLSPDVECLGVREGIGVGSDHKPLILDVRLRR